MNSNDFARGGTAPIVGKGKSPFNQAPNIVRPKTRAADNDFYDINVELRNNRAGISGMNGGGNGDIKIDRGEFAQEPTRRSVSRGRSGRDTSSSKKPAIPPGALSAYTQNMTNIVLNVSKKNQRVSSANSQRVVKDTKANMNQLNDLRAAYGAAALPLSKSSSPARGKSRGSELNEEYDGRPGNAHYPPLDEPVEFSHDLVVEDEITAEGAFMPNRYNTHELGRANEIITKTMMTSSPNTTDGSPFGRRPSKKLLALSPQTKLGKKAIESDSYNRKMIVRDTPSPLSTYDTTPDIEILGSSRSDIGMTAEPMFSVPDEILLRPVPPYSTSNASVRTTTTGEVRHNLSNKPVHTDFPMVTDDDRLEDYLDYSDNDDVGESYDGTHSRGASAKISKLMKSYEASKNREDSVPIEASGEDSKEFAGVPARPQSRKLYLGNERGSRPTPTIKAPRSAGARYGAYSPLKGGDDSTAVEGHSNPDEVRKGGMKRLGSLDNIKSQLWEEDANKERPPSRQSSAFPVHLADDNHSNNNVAGGNTGDSASSSSSAVPNSATKNRKKSATAAATATPTRGSMDHGDIIDSASPALNSKFSPSPQRGMPMTMESINSSLSGSPHTVPSIVPTVVPITVTSGGLHAEVTIDHIPSSSGSVASGSYLAPNTELRSIKKNRSGGGTNTVTSTTGDDDDTGSVNSAYQKRPPSRQKIAAQHLFDNDHPAVAGDGLATARPTSTRGSSRAGTTSNGNNNNNNNNSNNSSVVDNVINSSSSNNVPAIKPPSTAVGPPSRGGSARSQINTARSLTSRSKMYYDPKDDGFGDIDASNAPFVINVNYGSSNSQSSIEVIPMGEDINPTLRSTSAPMPHHHSLHQQQLQQQQQQQQQQQSSPYRKASLPAGDRMLTDKVINGRTRINPIVRDTNPPLSGVSSAGNNSNNNSNNNNNPRSSLPSPYSAPFEPPVLRPKSVTAGVVSTTNAKLAANGAPPRKKYVSSQQAAATEAEFGANGNDTLRSMSAGQGYHQHHPTTSASVHHTHNNSNSSNMKALAPRSAFGDWTEPDPRLIPRAQNKFGLESDTGWTSPSFANEPMSLYHHTNAHQVPRPATYRARSHSRSDDDLENDDHLAVEDYPGSHHNHILYHDDDMTIMTDDSGNEAMMLEQSLSLQSFPLESSLGEDFLSLFAPAGPPP